MVFVKMARIKIYGSLCIENLESGCKQDGFHMVGGTLYAYPAAGSLLAVRTLCHTLIAIVLLCEHTISYYQ